jgi:hypothetical protein
MEIPIEDRRKQSDLIVKTLAAKTANSVHMNDRVVIIYNQAIDDVLDAIDVYAEKNPQHRLAFESLKVAISGWMPLV